MKVKCGTDIIEIERIKESVESLDGKFTKRVFTENEIKYCESKKAQKYQHYAARFAAKEAIFKAISKILEDKYSITWKDVEIINDENGRPEVVFLNKEYQEIQDIDISISHCKEFAISNVIIILKN